MADAPRCAGQDQRLALFIWHLRHDGENMPLPLLRIQPRLDPRLGWGVAAEHDAVVEAMRPAVPELDLERYRPVALPIGWPRHIISGKLRLVAFDRLFERRTARERPRLLRGPGADTTLVRARGEIGVGVGLAHHFDRSADPHLAM